MSEPGARRAGVARARARATARPAAGRGRRRAPLLALALGSLVVGVILMVAFEHTVTRVLGLLGLFTFIAVGVFLIADPAWLEADDEWDHEDR
jgi:hypothetical protein